MDLPYTRHMATQERDELHRLIDNLPDDTVHDLLVMARDRQEESPRRFPWAGILHEAPDFALRAKETMRAERGGGE